MTVTIRNAVDADLDDESVFTWSSAGINTR
jgi:hypothetical protein